MYEEEVFYCRFSLKKITKSLPLFLSNLPQVFWKCSCVIKNVYCNEYKSNLLREISLKIKKKFNLIKSIFIIFLDVTKIYTGFDL